MCCSSLRLGAGKSCVMAYMAKAVTSKGNFVLLILHRNELKLQLTKTFKQWGVNMDLALIGMVQSMKKHLGKIPVPALIICEEGHHGVAKTYLDVFNYYPDTKCIFLTATPIRLGGRGLGDICDDLIVGVTAKWLIENGYLAPYKHFSVSVADLTGVKISKGEYDIKEMAAIMEDDKIYGDTISNYKLIADGTKAIAYCSSVKSAYETAEEFKRHGYLAEALDGKSDSKHRLAVMEKFRTGEITILTNNALFGEGIDIADCETILLLKKTLSLASYIQMAMRGMRPDKNNPNKVSKIIDYCGNVFEHGFVDDEREWALDSSKKNEQNTVTVKTCPTCFAVLKSDVTICPYCGMDFTEEIRERKQKELVEAELVEVKRLNDERIANLKYSDVKNFTTFGELVEFQQHNKYKFAWVIQRALAMDIYIPEKYNNMMKHMNIINIDI